MNGYLLLAVLLAFLAESLTEYFAGPIAKLIARWIPGTDPEVTPDLRYVAAAVGIGLAIAYQLDLPAAAGLPAAAPLVGQILTGLIIGRGSNYLNDLVSLIQ